MADPLSVPGEEQSSNTVEEVFNYPGESQQWYRWILLIIY